MIQKLNLAASQTTSYWLWSFKNNRGISSKFHVENLIVVNESAEDFAAKRKHILSTYILVRFTRVL